VRALSSPFRAAVILAVLQSFVVTVSVSAQVSGASVSGPPSPSGHYYALVIGNDDYVSLPKLKTAAADAREVERVLRETYGFQTKLLLNATRAQIISELYAYRRVLTADANLVIYYAGHGYNDKDADKAYWLPVDATGDDNSNWIIADEITTGIRVIPARHVLVIADSCYSGTLTRGLSLSSPPPAERGQFLQKMSAGHSRTLMASGGNEPVADNGGGGHSIFAAALLNGLQRMEKTQFTAGELFSNYVIESVAGRAEQTPVYDPLRNSGHESGDFVFVRVKIDGKTVEVTVSTPPGAKVDPAQQELTFWSSIENSADAEDFRDYLSKYPKGLYAGIAQRRVAALSIAPTSTPSSAVTNTTSAARPDSLLGVATNPDITTPATSDEPSLPLWGSTLLIVPDSGIYVADAKRGGVVVFDADVNQGARHFIDLNSGKPWQMVIAPRRGEVYVIDEVSQTVGVIDVRTRKLVQRFQAGNTPRAIAITPDERKLYVANQQPAPQGTISVIDLSSRQTKKSISGVNCPESLAVSPDGRFLYVSSQCGAGEDPVFVVDTRTDTVVNTIPGLRETLRRTRRLLYPRFIDGKTFIHSRPNQHHRH